jgi:hypothetical protein
MLTQRSRSHPLLISIILAIVLAVILIGVGFSSSSSTDKSLVSGTSGYSITGEFAVNGTADVKRSSVKAAKARSQDIVLWGSWVADDTHTGKLVSPAFNAPGILSLFVAGFPKATGNELFLEQVETQERLNLKVGTPGNRWKQLYWFLPVNWWGHSVRLVAIDSTQKPAEWFGISSPLETSFINFIGRQISSLTLIPAYLFHFALFLLLGLPLAALIVQRQKLNPSFVLILGITISSLIGYITFWGYFINYIFGIVFSVLGLLSGIGYTVFLVRKKALAKLLSVPDVILPTLVMAVVGLTYLAVLYILPTGDPAELLAEGRFFAMDLPPDNVLPKMFADRLYAGQDPRPLLGEWLSSDRPPLQTGIILLQRPLMSLTGLPGGLYYQILATIAQCSWVAAIWALCRTLQFSGRRIAIVLAFSIFSGFFLLHTVFVWPKLLAGAMVVFAFTILLPSILESRRPTAIEVGLAAGATALGMLSHGGVVFTVPALVTVMVLRPKIFPGIPQILIGSVIFGLLLAPWGAYQKFYEPPGNRLVKWHLAGVENPNDRRPSLQTILEAYRGLTIPKLLDHKWQNVEALARDTSGRLQSNDTLRKNASDSRRTYEFFYLFRGLGILNIGWLVFLVNLFRKSDPGDTSRKINLLLEVILVSLAFWVLVMFGPGTTVIHQGSYATMILLFTALPALLSQLPRLLCYALLSAQIVLVIYDWFISTTFSSAEWLMNAPNLFYLGLIAIGTVSIIKILKHISDQSELAV